MSSYFNATKAGFYLELHTVYHWIYFYSESYILYHFIFYLSKSPSETKGFYVIAREIFIIIMKEYKGK